MAPQNDPRFFKGTDATAAFLVGVGRDDSSAVGEAFAFFGRLAVGVKAGELVGGAR